MGAADVKGEPYWPGLFAKALEGVDVKALITNVGSGAGAAPAGGAPAAAASSDAPAAVEKKEEKKEESEEEDDDMGFGLHVLLTTSTVWAHHHVATATYNLYFKP